MALEEIAVQQGQDLLGGSLQPLIELIRPLFLQLSLLVGGIFGIYLILLIARVYYEKRKVRLLQDIRYDLDKLNLHYGLKTSKQKRGVFRKFFDFVIKKKRDREINKEFYEDEEEEKPKKKKKK